MTKIGKILLCSTGLLLLFFIYLIDLSNKPISEENYFIFSPVPSVVSNQTDNHSLLGSVVLKALEGTKGTYSIYIKNLKTSETFALDENRIYQAGSLYKLWLLGPVYSKLKAGEIKLTDTMTDNVGVLNKKFGVDSALTELPEDQDITISVGDAIVQMITISHNFSAMLLLEKFGRTTVNDSNISIGLLNSRFKELPYTTAFDTALIFEKLYKGEIVDKDSSSKILDILKQQTFNDGVPKFLPKNIEVAHKTGDIDMFKHDCGIVFSPKSDYIICVLSESESPSGALDRIALVSKSVYDYFMK